MNAQQPGNEMSHVIKMYLQTQVNVADMISLSLDLDLNE